MRILLLGEYSNVHATLAEGLRFHGHEVVVASDGDGWKDYPRDIDLRRHMPQGKMAAIAYYASLWKKFLAFCGFDIVQIINPLFLPLKAERIMPFYRYLRRNNKRVVMGAYGMDYFYVKACLDCTTFRYSDFNIGTSLRHYPLGDAFIADWYKGEKGRLCKEVAKDCDAIVAGLYEYYAAYANTFPGKTHFIPFPISIKQQVEMKGREGAIRFFVGIQKGKEEYKGTDIMLRALKRIEKEMPERCKVEIAESIPFEEYCRRLEDCDILVDQLYSYTPAMNALEAMSRGIAVVSGGEPENYEILGEKELRPVINTYPSENDVYEKLLDIVMHPETISRLKAEGLEYIKRHHKKEDVAEKYLQLYQKIL